MMNEKIVTSDYMTAIEIIAEHDPKKARFFENIVDLNNELFEIISSIILRRFGENNDESRNRMQELRACSYEKLIDKYIREYMIENELGDYISEEDYVKRYGKDAYWKQFKES